MLTEALWGLATAGGTAMAGAVATDVWRSARLRFSGRHGQGESARGRGAAARGRPAPTKAERVEAEQDKATRDETARIETARIERETVETADVERETVETAGVGSRRLGRAAADIAGTGTPGREPGHRLGSRSRQSCLQHNIARDGGTQHITLSGDLNVHVSVGRESRGSR